jgi:hypothetical protein
MAVAKYGRTISVNLVDLTYLTGDNIQLTTTWDNKAIQEGSTAKEISADGLTMVSISEFQRGKWVKVATL